MKRTLLPLALAATALLSGCLIPEKFDARITINPDASYRVRFNGSAAHVQAMVLMKESGRPLHANVEDSLKAEARELSKMPGVTRAAYTGNGRYDLAVDNSLKAGMPVDVLDMIKVRTGKDGVMTIASPQIDAKTQAEIRKLGVSLNGNLTVELPKNAEVLSSNATSSPSLMGLFGAYGWKIGSIEQAPVMRIRFKS